MGKINADLLALENGVKPPSMDYSLESYIEEKSIINQITYKTIDEDFYINAFDATLVSMYPQLMTLVLEEYEKNKHRTPLQEITERQENKSHFILNDEPDKQTDADGLKATKPTYPV
jgi:hypothetical protein